MRVLVPLGVRFGQLVTLWRLPPSPGCDAVLVEVLCDCGVRCVKRWNHLRTGATTSCGCGRIKTGLYRRGSKPPEEASYRGMKQRCMNPRDRAYPHYGGRGIRVCDRWLESLENFMADMGPRPGPGYSIDRIDVNGDYEPGNCRWATTKQQNRNQRRTILSETLAQNIRDRHAAGERQCDIARALRVSSVAVNAVVHGKEWA